MEGYISSIIFLVRGSSFAYAINALPTNVCGRILLHRRSSWPVESVQEWDCKLVQPLWKSVWQFLRKLDIFEDGVSLCSSGWPENHDVEQGGPELLVILLSQPFKYRDYKYEPRQLAQRFVLTEAKGSQPSPV